MKRDLLGLRLIYNEDDLSMVHVYLYGLAYWRADTNQHVHYIVPLNLIVRLVRRVWFWMLKGGGFRMAYEDELWKARRAGYKEGRIVERDKWESALDRLASQLPHWEYALKNTQFGKNGGSCFEACDYEEMYNEVRDLFATYLRKPIK